MNLEKILMQVTGYFNNNQVPYVVVGGWAAIAWGRARTTFDIDLIIDHKKLDLLPFVDFLESIDMATSMDDIEAAIRERSHASILFKQKPVLRIDFKGIYSSMDREAIMTSRKVIIDGNPVNIGSPENLIAHKLKFGSERDLEDALVVYIIQLKEKQLDISYLRKLCSKLNVLAELEKLIDSTDRNKS